MKKTIGEKIVDAWIKPPEKASLQRRITIQERSELARLVDEAIEAERAEWIKSAMRISHDKTT